MKSHLEFHPNSEHQISSHWPWTSLHTAISHQLTDVPLNTPSRVANDLKWPSSCDELMIPRFSDSQVSVPSTTPGNLSFPVPKALSPCLGGVCYHFIPLRESYLAPIVGLPDCLTLKGPCPSQLAFLQHSTKPGTKEVFDIRRHLFSSSPTLPPRLRLRPQPTDHCACLSEVLSAPDFCSYHFLLLSEPSVTPPLPPSQAPSPAFPSTAQQRRLQRSTPKCILLLAPDVLTQVPVVPLS